MKDTTQAVIVRRTVAASPARVFEAFQHAGALTHWFSPHKDIAVDVLTFQFKPQGAFRFRFSYPDGRQSAVKGIYRTITPCRELAFSWVWEEPDQHSGINTEVRISIKPLEQGTEITVAHSRLPNRQSKDRYAAGWSDQLDRLERYLLQTASQTTA